MPLPSDRALSARPSDHNRIGDHRVLASTSKRFACRARPRPTLPWLPTRGNLVPRQWHRDRKSQGVYGGVVPVRRQVLLADPVLIHDKRRAINHSQFRESTRKSFVVVRTLLEATGAPTFPQRVPTAGLSSLGGASTRALRPRYLLVGPAYVSRHSRDSKARRARLWLTTGRRSFILCCGS
jgi:hypothetical protein